MFREYSTPTVKTLLGFLRAALSWIALLDAIGEEATDDIFKTVVDDAEISVLGIEKAFDSGTNAATAIINDKIVAFIIADNLLLESIMKEE